MKIPAVAIAICFSSGVAMGLWLAATNRAASRGFYLGESAAAILLIIAAIFLLSCQYFRAAAVLSFAAWLVLGFFAASIAQPPKPKNYVLSVVESGELDLHAPLRWHGALRDEPATLPWGVSYEIELSSVDYQERSVSLLGGLRASYTPRAEELAPPELHAGDQVAIVTQARLPQLFRDEGAFDRRGFLLSQGIDLTATLRSSKLLERGAPAKRSMHTVLAAVRRKLREALSSLIPGAPEEAAVLRAMLLGDRSFLDRSESVSFQKTGVFHVLVVAGLHVGAFAAFLFWVARKLKLSRVWTSFAVLACVVAYVGVVEQRPPVLRAALMTLVVVLALLFFRRVELLNSVAIVALVLLVASPSLLGDSSFQLSFLSMFCIAGLAAPWLDGTIEPYARGMRGWRDVTRDVSHPPHIAQFRIDLRSISSWLEAKLPATVAKRTTQSAAWLVSLFFRTAEMIVLTLVLQIGMLPLLARDFHRITLSGPLANLLAVPLTGILVPLGFATLLLAILFHQAAVFFVVPLHWLTALLLYSVNWIARGPHWSYRIPAPPPWLMIAFFASSVLLAITLRTSSVPSRWIKRFSFALLLAAAVAMATFPFAPRWQRGAFELSVLDVGQGDSLFLVFPEGHTILVDAGGSFSDPAHRSEMRGPDPGEEAVSPYLWSRGFKRIDVVALTHAHQDHIGGLTAIFDNFKVNTLWIGREVASPQQEQLEKLAISHGTQLIHELRGDHFDFGGAHGDFLWPQIVPEEVAASAKNDDSLIFRVVFGERSFLPPGDAEKMSENAILSESASDALRSDVLKIAHHGSKNSTTPDFLAAVQPRLAVISSGEQNSYGHPNPQLLERLSGAAVLTLRTDTNGAIHILSDGKTLQVSCFVACPEITAQVNSVQPQTPQNQQSKQQ